MRFTLKLTDSKSTTTIFDGIQPKRRNMMASKGSSWKGWEDSTPAAMPKSPDDQGDPGPNDTTGDWHGMPDSTPASMPMTPDKEP